MKQVEIATDAPSRLREAKRMGVPLPVVQQWLEHLAATPMDRRGDHPICDWLVLYSPILSHQIRSMMRLYSPFWPEFSGSGSRPVPHPEMGPYAGVIYAAKWEGEYGAARCRLLAFLIETLKADLQYEACLNSDKEAP